VKLRKATSRSDRFEVPFDALPRIEIFGPILQVATYKRGDSTPSCSGSAHRVRAHLGIHSRIESFVDHVIRSARWQHLRQSQHDGAVGRRAALGGEGLSGTGPKPAGRITFRDLLRRERLRSTCGGRAALPNCLRSKLTF